VRQYLIEHLTYLSFSYYFILARVEILLIINIDLNVGS
jgi:hypothetical protein